MKTNVFEVRNEVGELMGSYATRKKALAKAKRCRGQRPDRKSRAIVRALYSPIAEGSIGRKTFCYAQHPMGPLGLHVLVVRSFSTKS